MQVRKRRLLEMVTELVKEEGNFKGLKRAEKSSSHGTLSGGENCLRKRKNYIF